MKPLIYLPNLNSLRCIAAFMVVIHHIEHIKYSHHLSNAWDNVVVRQIGNLGVNLFFVLSGFLITYLLLKEYEQDGTINIRKFYFRRILRIWPLYYLITLLGFAVLPYFFSSQLYSAQWQMPASINTSLLLYLLLMPNFSIGFGPVPFASQLWSLGVEEQFYAVWPWLMKRAKNNLSLLTTTCLVIVTIYVIVPVIFTEGLWPLRIKKVLALMPMNCMAIGGLAAITGFAKNTLATKFKRILFHRFYQVLIVITIIIMITEGVTFTNAQTVYAMLFGMLICNVALNPGNILNLECKPFNYMGKISYGIYMYHPLMIVIALHLLAPYEAATGVWLYLLSITFTVAISALSYRYFEQFFLSLKDKFAVITNSDTQKQKVGE